MNIGRQKIIPGNIDIAYEPEAIYVYVAHVQSVDDVRALRVISDIREEEKNLFGELMTLPMTLDPRELEQFASCK